MAGKGWAKLSGIGNLGRDPEVRKTNSGTSVVDLSVACTESVKRGEKYEDVTEWISVTLWGRNAENAAQYLRKGSKIHFEGRPETQKWKDEKTGQDRTRQRVTDARVTYLADYGNGGAKKDEPPPDDNGAPF